MDSYEGDDEGGGDVTGVCIAEKLLGWALGVGSCHLVALVRFSADDGMVTGGAGVEIGNSRCVIGSKNAVDLTRSLVWA